ncbi:RNA repair transcriptional activator RtcR [Myxococcus xanthus]|uniref:Transcriptional regulator n=1 Tax=Myxococcus xanthus TaxID=34 RepID=A0AAE6G3H1_MYXXA|nr:RNA repair transcriptional activator RtcR [Myxococcus xanthus]QDE69976.1 transcriptional regulator [Myxococcus xanthus]QDE77255.1 transcriptional regulator [Myxococcus xanthus]QDE84636.1 transcriptional regulator [Myxococcus xanthus]QDE98800.1 transcriptional regulator [Myxococcus xanthus]QDF06457.1 transcriptional regulator [Myxococcus xanthus]
MAKSRARKTVVLGMLGTTLDNGQGPQRWTRWRPTVALCQQEDLLVHRLELLHPPNATSLAGTLVGDIRQVSPETEVRGRPLDIQNPWDLEETYGALLDYVRGYAFNPEAEDYLVHITTGTHIAQICMFLLVESRLIPGKLVQVSPDPRDRAGAGTHTLIDLDLSQYDTLAARFRQEQREGLAFLKSGIDTRNAAFNRLIERIEQVAVQSRAPLLITGPTGAGKSQLARRIYALKKSRRGVAGPFVDLNCATLRGDGAMSALFGHVKGAFTGALSDRPGLLRQANGGVLFLDEIGELGADEQAMLLRALEDKRFLPVGADREVESDFQLIAGTNRDLQVEVERGRFREDLLARINLWTFRLPALRERPEDIPPNLLFELDQSSEAVGTRVTMNKEAQERFLDFATSSEARWAGNFRDLNAAVLRMATLAAGGRITRDVVDEELERLREQWRPSGAKAAVVAGDLVAEVLGENLASELDRFDRVQLADVLSVCRASRSLSDAGRVLFAQSRAQKKSVNDADRLKKYLARFGLTWADVSGRGA